MLYRSLVYVYKYGRSEVYLSLISLIHPVLTCQAHGPYSKFMVQWGRQVSQLLLRSCKMLS